MKIRQLKLAILAISIVLFFGLVSAATETDTFKVIVKAEPVYQINSNGLGFGIYKALNSIPFAINTTAVDPNRNIFIAHEVDIDSVGNINDVADQTMKPAGGTETLGYSLDCLLANIDSTASAIGGRPVEIGGEISRIMGDITHRMSIGLPVNTTASGEITALRNGDYVNT